LPEKKGESVRIEIGTTDATEDDMMTKTTYRFRETADVHETSARSGLTLDQALELARASSCPVVETLGAEFRWTQVVARIAIREQGTRFASCASLMVGRKCVATTDEVPFGFSARARELAERLAAGLGMAAAD
jgi:hypothetical protein